MQPTQRINASIASISTVQHRAYGAPQLRAAGVDRFAVGRRVRAGTCHVVLGRVYADGPPGTQLPTLTRRSAGLLACGPDSALVRQTAAQHLGIWNRGTRVVHVGGPRRRRLRSAPWLRCHRCTFADSDVAVVELLRCTTALRTILDLGWELTAWQVAAVIREAVRRALLDVSELERALRGRRSRAACVVRRALHVRAAGSAGTRSWTEDVALDGILRHTDIAEPLVNVRGAAGLAGVELDFVWPTERVVLEVDGSGHDEPGLRMDDEAKDRELRARGWIVVRVTADQVHHDLPGVLAAVVRALAGRHQ